MRAMTIFIIIAVLGFFHVISSEATGWCFAVWFVVMVAYSQLSDPFKNATLFEERAESDLIPPQGLGGYVADSEYVSPPPQGGDATIPVESRSDFGYTTKEVVDALLYIGQALTRQESASDSKYDEPQATYPVMTMEQKG